MHTVNHTVRLLVSEQLVVMATRCGCLTVGRNRNLLPIDNTVHVIIAVQGVVRLLFIDELPPLLWPAR